MIIIIDAYNYIKSVSDQKFIHEQAIQAWIVKFQNYVALRGNKIVLVFDAGPSFYQTTESHGAVQVLYAGHRQSADDVINVWLQQHVGHDVLLVTSDRQIRNFADTLQIVSINSHDFDKIFNEVMQQEEKFEHTMNTLIYKTKHDNQHDRNLDQLMEQGSRNLVDAAIKNEYDISVRVKDGTKTSKNDKQTLKKINKI